jgi:hypothetical protein
MRDELVGKRAIALLSANTSSGTELKKVVVVARAADYEGVATYKVAVLGTKDQDFRYVSVKNLTPMLTDVDWSEVVEYILYDMFESWNLSKLEKIAKTEMTIEELYDTDWFSYSTATYKDWLVASTERRIAHIIRGRYRSGQDEDCD